MVESVIAPKTPRGKDWIDGGPIPPQFTLGYPGRYWLYPEPRLTVMSSVEVANDENDIDKGPEYHVSVSKNGGRCSKNEAQFVLRAFGMEDADEDNHVPNGVVRNFWKPVAEKFIGHVCPCKDTETPVVEDDYEWRGIN